MARSVLRVLDILSIVLLLPFALFVVFFFLLVDVGIWGPTVGLLLNACAVGAVIYFLGFYGGTGRCISSTLLVLFWLFSLPVIVFGFAPGNFIDIGVVLPKLIALLYPLLYIYLLYQAHLQRLFFRMVALLFLFCYTFLTTTLLTVWFKDENTPLLALVLLFLFSLFIILYLLYRVFLPVPEKEAVY